MAAQSGEMRSSAVVSLHLFHLSIRCSTLHPLTHPPTPSQSLHELPPVFLYFSFPSSLSPSPSPSFPACLFSPLPSPLLPPVLSFSAKRLAGVFSTVVTFKTECHHCLSRSLSSLPLTCLSLCPLLLLFALPPCSILPSSSCSEGLLDRMLCLEERLALIQLSSVCVWAVRVFSVCEKRRRPVKYISDPYLWMPSLTSLCQCVAFSAHPPHLSSAAAARRQPDQA